MILEFTIYNTGTDLYFRLLKTFKKEFISQILGYRFEKMAAYQKESPLGQTGPLGLSNLPTTSPTPVATKKSPTTAAAHSGLSLLRPSARIAAKLIKMKIVKVSEIWPHLSPADQTVTDTYRDNFSVAYEVLGQ